MLGTSLSATKWRALGLLVLGCILVASPSFDAPAKGKEQNHFMQIFGYLAGTRLLHLLTSVVLLTVDVGASII
jgi:hypothetical protein